MTMMVNRLCKIYHFRMAPTGHSPLWREQFGCVKKGIPSDWLCFFT